MKLGEYMKGGGGGKEPPQSGPVVNGKNQNDYSAAERPCLAHGCPNLGTITSSVTYSSNASWFCRFHHEKDPHDFAKITRRLKLGLSPYLTHSPEELEQEETL